MILSVTILGIVIAFALWLFSNHQNKVNRFLAIYYLSLALYGLEHYFVMYSGSVFWTATTYINISFIFLLPGPFLLFYVRGLITDQQSITRKDLIHFMPALINLLLLSPWLLNDFSIKKDLAEQIIDNPNILFSHNYLPFSIPPVLNFCLRAFSGIGYSLYCLKYIFKYHESTVMQNRSKQKAIQWIYLFVFFQILFFIIYLINTLISYTESIETVLYGRGSFFYITQGMFYMIQFLAILIFPPVLFSIQRILTVKYTHQSLHSEVA